MKQQPSYKRLKQLVFAGIIAVLFIPMIQHKFRFLEEKPLNGSFALSTKPEWTKKSWFSGEYQEKQDKYLAEHTGFYPSWVRLYNQWNFSLFDVIHANGVIAGKEHYLFEENYISAYYGMDFAGDKKIAETSRQLKLVQDTLKKKGIDLVVILAPGKASYVPEFIPDKYASSKKGKTNFEGYLKAFNKQAVAYIDMHTWFESMKRTTKHPLFSKTGIHWTAYGQFLVADSLVNYVSKSTKHEIPRLVLEKTELSDIALIDDGDIQKGANLMFDIRDLKLAYPKFHPNRAPEKEDPKVMVVSDSFYWGLFNSNVSNWLFNNGEFWYYNEQIYPNSYTKETWAKDQDLNKKLEENKVVFIICTDANLPRLGFGFIERAYELYYPKNKGTAFASPLI
ncbi:hypothetical protein [Fluviicola sp.]|uniref:alginate O-acetyltransferase AlgX-related protein n=1 Tax=Fluviicola sp. TaxID=1917219 RepID=UPI0031D14D90